MFKYLSPFPGDPILSLNESFARDTRKDKVNLGIGVYLDDDGRLPTMQAVRHAVEQATAMRGPFPYQPMEGAANFREAAQRLLFGQESEPVTSGRIATVQTLGGSGALKVGADFLRTHFGPRTVWVSDPSWDNHRSLFEGAGFEVRSYRYYDPATRGVDFDGLCAALYDAPAGSIIVLHGCCHNPTGADLSSQEWVRLAALLAERDLIPFLDIAYQGFGNGIEEDAFAIHALVEHELPFFVASSFSKNFGLYGERCGALNVVCADDSQAQTVLGQLKASVRRNYSSPPTFGGQLIATILHSDALRQQWSDELQTMRLRIRTMRERLGETLRAALPEYDFSHVTAQTGMFSYTGLNADQVTLLRERYGVYMVGSGRMCVAALSSSNVERVADAVAQVVQQAHVRSS